MTGRVEAPAARKVLRELETQRRRRKWILTGAGVFILLVAGFGWYTYLSMVHMLAPSGQDAKEAAAVLDTRPASASSEATKAAPVEYALVLGIDARKGETRSRSDTILLARLDSASKKVTLLSIPRDSRVQIDGHSGYCKINAANAYGGPALAITTVKQLTGLPVNHYVVINFQGFADIVDSLGGITVNVDKAIDDRNGTTAGSVSDVTHISAGVQTLNGAQALTYVRSRNTANGDFTRVAHQQQFLKALITQALQARNIAKLPSVMNAATGNVSTDLSVSQIASLAEAFKGLDGASIRSYTLPGSTKTIGGASYVILNMEASVVMISEFAAGNEPTSTAQ